MVEKLSLFYVNLDWDVLKDKVLPKYKIETFCLSLEDM